MRFPRSVAALALALTASLAHADATDAGALELATRVATRPANEGRAGMMHFRLENDAGSVRTRTALMLHSERNDVERIAIFFTQPAMIEETAFLSLNAATAPDENWLYLPATDRVRRLPASDRGDYFMGTDLTYGDIRDNFKFDLDDWQFRAPGSGDSSEGNHAVLEGSARTPALAKEMGYASFRARIDTATAFPVWIEYTDSDGEALKRVEVLEIARVGDADTAMRFSVTNLQTGHRTEVHFTDMRHVPDVADSLFEPEALAYGLPEVDL